jgi:hypothetical protein
MGDHVLALVFLASTPTNQGHVPDGAIKQIAVDDIHQQAAI